MSAPRQTAEPAVPKPYEVVAEFADRAGFEAAIRALLAAGFDRTDISVLASHDSLEVAGAIAGYADPGETQSIALTIEAELPWIAPVATTGVLLAASGPVGLAIAALVGAAAGAMALRPIFSEVTEQVHAEDFAAALEEGRILVWVLAPEGARAAEAEAILTQAGGTGLRRVSRPAPRAAG